MRRILHIDTSEFFRNVIQDICSGMDLDYTAASSGSEARKILSGGGVDLILTAVELPDTNGLDLVREIKRGPQAEIPVIVITSSDSLEMRKRMFSLGVADYILKTLPPEDLTRNIHEILSPSDDDENFERLKELRIAILDDSRMERRVMRSILNMNGFSRVEAFADPGELEAAGYTFDLYLVDMVLPGISGERVIRRIKSRQTKSLVIAVSGIDDSKAVSNVLLSGADDYITKPFDSGIFTARIRASGRTLLLMKELDEKNRTLHRLAITDGLTGLYNRRYIYSRLEKDLAQANDSDPYGVLIFDLDHFKRINDTMGHPAGDRVLKLAAKTIHTSVHPQGKAGRYGGEEFIVLLPGADASAVRSTGEKIRSAIENTKTQPGLQVTVSGGGSIRSPGEKPIRLLSRVDALLYRAKQEGRNRFYYGES